MNRTLRAAALALLTTLALAGCIRVDMSLTLNEDDTVDGYMVFAVEEGIGEILETTDEEAVGQIFGSDEDLTADFENATVETYKEDGFIGTKVSFAGESLDGFSLPDSGMTIVREDDEFVVTATNEPADEGEIPEGAQMTMSVTFPGAVSDHNGTLEGTTVTWDLLTAPEEMYARGGASAGGAFPMWLIFVVLGVAAVGALAAVLVMKSRQPASDDFTTNAGEGDPVQPEALEEPAAPVESDASLESEAPAEEPTPETDAPADTTGAEEDNKDS